MNGLMDLDDTYILLIFFFFSTLLNKIDINTVYIIWAKTSTVLMVLHQIQMKMTKRSTWSIHISNENYYKTNQFMKMDIIICNISKIIVTNFIIIQRTSWNKYLVESNKEIKHQWINCSNRKKGKAL